VNPCDQPYTWQKVVDDVVLIGFVDRGDGADPDATYSRDIPEFRRRIEALETEERVTFAVIDFANYGITGWDNGRALVGLVLGTHNRLKARGGGLLVCNHPAQFNPDLQQCFGCDKLIEIHRSQREALVAARSRLEDKEH
jgi:hypothetical protein